MIQMQILETEFAVAQAADLSGIDWSADFIFLAKTDEEISIVCPASQLPANCTQVVAGWRAIRVVGLLDFALTGIMAGLSGALAEAGISLFALSTYNTDYILVRTEALGNAVSALRGKGYLF
jgi:uncharacterized protein